MINPATRERVERALELLADGMPLRRAAEASGTTLRTVVRVCEDEGIPLRQNGRRYVLDSPPPRRSDDDQQAPGAVCGGLGLVAFAVTAALLRRRGGRGRAEGAR